MSGATFSRRGLVTAGAALAGGVAVSATAILAAKSLEADPIFDLIDTHRKAEAAFIDSIREDVRMADPRWLEYERIRELSNDKTEDAAADLVSVQPTTMAGVIALLSYAAEYVDKGNEWPDLEEDGEQNTWEVFLHRSLAEALAEIAGQ